MKIKEIILILLILISINTIFADSNGIWHYAKDVRGGIFGSDEGTQFFTFNNSLYTNMIKEYQTSGIKFKNSADINTLFISNNGNIGIGNINPTEKLHITGGNIKVDNLANCNGKLNTDASGIIKCDTDLVNDADSNIGNEYPIAGIGITVSGRTVNADTNYLATKAYVDSKVSSSSCPCGTCWTTSCPRSSCSLHENNVYYETLCTPGGGVPIMSVCLACSWSCFVAGTQVSMADGTLKNIEDIQVGEKLLGNNGSINKVLKLDRVTIGDRGTVKINNNVETTIDHPFLTTDGWKVVDLEYKLKSPSESFNFSENNPLDKSKLKQLEIGDKLIKNNKTEIIWSIERIYTRPKEEIVYNFDIDGDDTYIANGYVVHNGC